MEYSQISFTQIVYPYFIGVIGLETVCRFCFVPSASFFEFADTIFDLSVATISCISCLPVFVCFEVVIVHLLFSISNTFDWMFFAYAGCGKFQPINAPIANQNSVSNIVFSFVIVIVLGMTVMAPGDDPVFEQILGWTASMLVLLIVFSL